MFQEMKCNIALENLENEANPRIKFSHQKQIESKKYSKVKNGSKIISLIK